MRKSPNKTCIIRVGSRHQPSRNLERYPAEVNSLFQEITNSPELTVTVVGHATTMPDAADHHLPTRGCAYTVDLADGGGGDSVTLQVWCDMSQLQFAISID